MESGSFNVGYEINIIMDNLSHYESRTGIIACTPEDFYTFVTDIRNFEQFVPKGSITNLQTDKESCSFSVTMLGTVNVRLSEKEEFSKVVYYGDAMKKNDFTLILEISDSGNNSGEVKVVLRADLNPMLKIMAANPIAQFLEMLVSEMEKFKGWKNVNG
jgi:carbon monoxide dehydrogenase subunit G